MLTPGLRRCPDGWFEVDKVYPPNPVLDEIVSQKETMRAWKDVVTRRIIDFRREVEREDLPWALGRRREYLLWQIESLEHSLTKWKLLCGRLALRERRMVLRDWILKFGGMSPYPAKLKSVRKKIEALDNREQIVFGKITKEMMASARQVRLSEYLHRPLGSKILCPFHGDSNPSAHLFSDGAFCFVCHRQIDTISWLTEVEGLSFSQAVKKLLT